MIQCVTLRINEINGGEATTKTTIPVGGTTPTHGGTIGGAKNPPGARRIDRHGTPVTTVMGTGTTTPRYRGDLHGGQEPLQG